MEYHYQKWGLVVMSIEEETLYMAFWNVPPAMFSIKYGTCPKIIVD